MTAIDTTPSCNLEHEAFIYGSVDDYVNVLAPLLVDAVESGQEAFGVVPARNAHLLRDAVGAAADHVQWLDSQEIYEHPARTIARYDATLRGLAPGAKAFVIGEIQFGATELDRLTWTRYEATAGRVLDHHRARVICPYDRQALAASVIADVWRTHPRVREGVGWEPSGQFVDPARLLRALPPVADLPARPADVELLDERSARAARRAFVTLASDWGLPPEQVDDLTVGVNEVVTNAIVHGGGAASLRLWCDDGTLTCSVEDRGRGVDDPFLGFRPPVTDAEGGFGLWLARQVFDRSHITLSPLGGLQVILAVDRPRA